MNLLNTLQNLKKDKKKLIIIGVSFFAFMVIFDVLLVILLTDDNIENSDIKIEENIISIDSSKVQEVKKTDKISELLEFSSDSIKSRIVKESDTSIVNSDIDVNIKSKKFKLNVKLKYYFTPVPSNEEIIRLTRLFNYRLGKLLEEHGTDRLSIEKLEKEYNLFLKNKIIEQPYHYSGHVSVDLEKFDLQKE